MDAKDAIRNEKVKTAYEYLEQGVLEVHFRTDVDGVRIPSAIRKRRAERTALMFSGPFVKPPTQKLKLSAKGIEGIVAFKTGHFRCEVPWEAIVVMSGQSVTGMPMPAISWEGV